MTDPRVHLRRVDRLAVRLEVEDVPHRDRLLALELPDLDRVLLEARGARRCGDRGLVDLRVEAESLRGLVVLLPREDELTPGRLGVELREAGTRAVGAVVAGGVEDLDELRLQPDR